MRSMVGLVVFLLGAGAGFAEKEPTPDYVSLFAENNAKIRAINASDPSCTNYVQWVESAISYKRKLHLQKESIPWLEDLSATSTNNWKILYAAARGYVRVGYHNEVYRWRSIQLMDQAYRLTLDEEVRGEELGRLVEDYIDLLLLYRGERPYLLRTGTLALSEDEVESYPSGTSDRALIFFECPPSYQAAANDGELIRWLIEKGLPRSYAGEYRPSARRMADFAVIVAGAHRTVTQYDPALDTREILHALKDDETLKPVDDPWNVEEENWYERPKLPKAYQYIPVYQELAEQGDLDAANTLGNIFFTRCQFKRAAHYYELAGATNAVSSIRSNYGEIVECPAQVGGQPASFDYTYRNGSELLVKVVRISPINFEERMSQGKVIREELRFLSGAGWDPGSRWMKRETVAEWSVPMDPHPDHWDRTQKIELPLLEAGNYRIHATLKGGNSSEKFLFLNDTLVLLNKVGDKTSSRLNFSYIFSDAATGEPLGDQVFHMVGWKRQNEKIEQVLKGRTDRHGCYIFDEWELDAFDQKCILINREPRGLVACRVPYDPDYYSYRNFTNRTFQSARNFFCTTDRSVYRPGDTGFFKVAFGEDRSPLSLEIQGWKSSIPFEADGALEQAVTVLPDLHGGAEGCFRIPDDAKPGRYEISEGVEGKNKSTTFLVEEYNAPDHKVSAIFLPSRFLEVVATDAEGRPLANAEVHISASSFSDRSARSWCPEDTYDFCFGRGYWWHGGQLGCREGMEDKHRDARIEVKGALDAAGQFKVKLEGSDLLDVLGISGLLYVNVDVINNGELVFEDNFRLRSLFPQSTVCCWLDKAFYEPSEVIHCHVAQEKKIGKPILDLFQVSGTNLVAINTFSVTAPSVELGRLSPGTYEVQATVDGNKSKPFRFAVLGGFPEGLSAENPLRVVCEKGHYTSGETARVLVQADRPGRSVYLFKRITASKPIVVKMDSTERVINIPLTEEDVDFSSFVAMAVEGGEPYFSACQIPVVDQGVPVGRIEIESERTNYRPGENVKLALQALDDAEKGRPCSIAVSVYNKSVDSPRGRPDIRKLQFSLQKKMGGNGYVEMYDNWPTVHRSGNKRRLIDFYYFKGGLPVKERGFRVIDEGHYHSFPSFGHDYLCYREDRLNYAPEPSDPNTEFQSIGDPCRTAYWNATVDTDEEGRATVEFPMPDGEADWRVIVWGVSTNYAASAETTITCRDKEL